MATIDSTLDAAHQRPGSGPGVAGGMSMLAHDIRGALQGIVGGVAALDRSQLPAELVEQVERIAAAARSLEGLIGMATDRTERFDDTDDAETVLGDFLEYFRSRWAGEAHGAEMDLVIAPAADLPFALRLPHLVLARMLGNLTDNAIRHGRRGTVELSLVRSEDRGLIVSVADQGPGIPPRILGGRTEATGRDGGHGLGLRIVGDLARRIGCAFSLANHPGGGSVATLAFLPESVVENDTGAMETPGASFPELAGLHVLLAEDNPTNQLVALQMLRALDVEATVASDGIDALERFEQGTYDLLLVDIEMPRLSGLDVIRKIRERGDARSTVPIIALTAYALREHRDRITAAGADGLISKPITSVEALGHGLAQCAGKTRETRMPDDDSPPEPAPAETMPVIDRDVYATLVAAIGDEMIAELLDKVTADLDSAGADLSRARDPLDRDTIRGASHILISVAGALGAARLQTCAQALNAAAHRAEPGALLPEVDRCIREIGAATAFARDQRATA